MKNWLLDKITRQRLETFLNQHSSDELVLEIGASYKPNRQLYSREIAGDITYHPELDGQFDAHALPFADGSFERVVCIEVLEHCHTPQRVLDEIHRVLKPNGQVILTTRFVFPLHDVPHDYFRYTKYGLQHLCRAFSKIEIQEEVQSAETIAVLLQRLVFQVTWRLPLTKLALLLMAKVFLVLQKTLSAEYGDIHRSSPEESIMTSGYYLIATK